MDKKTQQEQQRDILQVGDKLILSELLLAKMKLSLLMTNEGFEITEALKDAEVVDDLLRYIMSDIRSDESKLALNKLFHENSDISVKACYKLWEATQDYKYIEEAFLWSVRGKANFLQSEIKAHSDKLQANLPDSLLQKEFDLDASIAFYEEKLFDPNNDKNNHEWDEILIEKRLAKEALIQHYESFYPKYHKLKYSNDKTESERNTTILKER